MWHTVLAKACSDGIMNQFPLGFGQSFLPRSRQVEVFLFMDANISSCRPSKLPLRKISQLRLGSVL
jgi:hypothetical protein